MSAHQRAVLATALPLLIVSASISSTASATEAGLEEVIVTATKTGATNLQQTAISITAVSADELKRAQITSPRELTQLVPGLTVGQNISNGQIYIRGIGTNNVSTGGDPSSTIHVDGVYMARPLSTFSEMLAVERVEVLRGPQGTLYGRNATGGTINIITRKPSTEGMQAEVKGVVGSYNQRELEGYVNLPFSDRAAVNLAIRNGVRDGYVENAASTGEDEFNDRNLTTARLGFMVQPMDDIKALFMVDYLDRDEEPIQHRPLFVTPEGVTLDAAAAADNPSDFWTVNIPAHPLLDNHATEETVGYNLTLSWDINDQMTLTSITGYREIDYSVATDTDYSSVDSRISRLKQEQDQLTQELQFEFNSDRVDVLLGYFWFEEDDTSEFNAELLSEVSNSSALERFMAAINGNVQTESVAVFADVVYRVTDEFSLNVGGRYSKDRKEHIGSSTVFQTQIDEFGAVSDFVIPGFDQNEDQSWESFDPKLGANLQLSDHSMLYGTVSWGYKSGGYNFTQGDSEYAPEEIIAYEMGVKVSSDNQRIRLNVGAFIYDYTDLQVLQFEVADGGSAPQTVISNAADAEVRGMEVELKALPLEQWEVGISMALLNAEYETYITKRTATTEAEFINVTGNQLNNAPKQTFILTSDYRLPVSSGELSFRADYRWQDEIYFSAFNDDSNSQEAYGVLNGGVGYESGDGRWDVELFGKNLTDEEYANASHDFSPLGVTVTINPPRTFGLRGGYYFD